MVGHAQLKFVMTECSKTQIRLTGLMYDHIQLPTKAISKFICSVESFNYSFRKYKFELNLLSRFGSVSSVREFIDYTSYIVINMKS